jgi:hypothetical protein
MPSGSTVAAKTSFALIDLVSKYITYKNLLIEVYSKKNSLAINDGAPYENSTLTLTPRQIQNTAPETIACYTFGYMWISI